MTIAPMPEELFTTVARHISPEQPVGWEGGRPRVTVRVSWFVLATGARWEDVPPEPGLSGRTEQGRIRPWEEAGAWDRLPAALRADSVTGFNVLTAHYPSDAHCFRSCGLDSNTHP
jgi:hypothetical protein